MAGTATQQDVFQIRSDVSALQRSVQQTQARVEAISAQAGSRQRPAQDEHDREVAGLASRIDSLTTTVNRLAGRVDELSGRVEALARQGRAVSPATTAAPPAPRPAAPAPPVTPPTATPSQAPAAIATPQPPPAQTAARPAPAPARPQDVYQAAYLDFSKGSYTLAVSGFREFLRRFPDHELAGNAQYWIGESYFSIARGHANSGQADQASQALQQAVLEFRKVVANYPRGETVPTALYKEGLALLELKQPALAQARLQYLIDNFPQAAEVPLAKERLASLRER